MNQLNMQEIQMAAAIFKLCLQLFQNWMIWLLGFHFIYDVFEIYHILVELV